MAWSFTNLSYGWKIATGIALAGTTIYVAVNTRWRVNQVDVIELALGVHERCLATQLTTNPTYSVEPPSFVRSWYSNSYVTTNVPGDAATNWTAQLHTNIYTNVIGWRMNRAMMVELDAKLIALCPFYVDTNSVYDGTTNIIMHTFTGLLTSLDLGDHTNFTAIPSIGTNIATYGPWAWRNYVVAWQERYKVLNALTRTKVDLFNYSRRTAASWYYGPWQDSWSEEKTYQEGHIATNMYYEKRTFQCLTAGAGSDLDGGEVGERAAVITSDRILGNDISGLTTSISYVVSCWVYPTVLWDYPFGGGNNPEGYTNSPFNAYYPPPESSFDANSLGVTNGGWNLVTLPFGLASGVTPNWCANPVGSYIWVWPDYVWTGSPRVWILSTSGSRVLFFGETRGFEITEDHQIAYADWQFNYCTNKYW